MHRRTFLCGCGAAALTAGCAQAPVTGRSQLILVSDQEMNQAGAQAYRQVIRLLPFSITWLVLGVGITWLLGLTFPYLLIWFSVFTAFSYWAMNKDEFRYSRNGLERHKVDSAVTVRLTELEHSHELRKMALEGYLRHLDEGGQHGQQR